MNKKQIKAFETWMRKALFVDADRYGPCIEMRLVHIVEGGQAGAMVGSYEVGPAIGDDGMKDLILQINQEADTDATGLGQFQKYAVQAYYAEDGDHVPKSRYIFGVQGGDGEAVSTDGMNTEPPNQVGLISQLQRHNEVLARLNVQSNAQVQATLGNMVEKQAAIIDKLVSEKFDAIEVMSQLYDKKDERQARIKEIEEGSALKRQMAENAIPILQTIGMKLLGTGQTAIKGDTGEALKKFAKALQPEQVAKMLEALNPGQQALAFEFFQSALKESESETDSAPQPLKNGVS